MKLIVTSQGPEATDPVDPRFGRAPYFLVCDVETGGFTALDNRDQAAAAQGAGVQAAQIVAGSGAQIVLTGHCGPKAFAVLSEAGLQVYAGATGSVQDAVHAWYEGKLELLATPDGIPHH